MQLDEQSNDGHRHNVYGTGVGVMLANGGGVTEGWIATRWRMTR